MATTAQDIINDAFLRMGVYAPGESIADSDSQRMLSILNDMLDQWSNENLACFAYSQQSGALTVNKAQYSIGTSGGADFAITRPLKLQDGPGMAYIQDSNSNNYYVEVVPLDEWNLIGNRGSTTTSNVPNTLFYDPQFPLGLLNFWPTPNAGGYTAFWNSYLQLVDFAATSTAVSLPPGYKDALQKNLAVEAWGDFLSGEPTGWRVKQAMDAKGNIKRTNIRPLRAVYDAEIVSRATGTYNIYTDSPGTRSAS